MPHSAVPAIRHVLERCVRATLHRKFGKYGDTLQELPARVRYARTGTARERLGLAEVVGL